MNIVNNMADAIISSRDFCGDERQAAIDCAADEFGRRPTRSELSQAFICADKIWRHFQNASGVTAPISSHERICITQIMEQA